MAKKKAKKKVKVKAKKKTTKKKVAKKVAKKAAKKATKKDDKRFIAKFLYFSNYDNEKENKENVVENIFYFSDMESLKNYINEDEDYDDSEGLNFNAKSRLIEAGRELISITGELVTTYAIRLADLDGEEAKKEELIISFLDKLKNPGWNYIDCISANDGWYMIFEGSYGIDYYDKAMLEITEENDFNLVLYDFSGNWYQYYCAGEYDSGSIADPEASNYKLYTKEVIKLKKYLIKKGIVVKS
jgi:hypothetical protein